ncbi:hypothetical protein [Borborobacter arsenicus]|uniref:hypothetical protein n=1 Tax=Borborobacter arsenicus TaxID=1851146 RepID=UPI001FE18364|nr:hypothetical protein [Pseudaminobacter arsenicus]
MGELLGQPLQFRIAARLPSFKSLRFLTKLPDQFLEPFLKPLLFRDNLVLRLLDLALIFRRIGALELKFCLRTPNPCGDVRSFDGTDTVNLLQIAPLCVERGGEAV